MELYREGGQARKFCQNNKKKKKKGEKRWVKKDSKKRKCRSTDFRRDKGWKKRVRLFPLLSCFQAQCGC